MIIKCVENLLEKVCNDKTSDLLLKEYHRLEGEAGYLIKGQCYVVYGLFEPDQLNGIKWYLLNYHGNRDYTVWFPEIFFEVIDPRFSQYWMTFWEKGPHTGEKGKMYVFPEYVEMDGFSWNLSEDEEQEVEIFKDYKRKFIEEAIL